MNGYRRRGGNLNNTGQFSEGDRTDQGEVLAGPDPVMAARMIAHRAHRGQVDKAGQPYAGHVDRTAAMVRACGGTDDQVAAAYLHDVAEDTDISLDDLRRMGVGEHVCSLVDAVTHRPSESREQYLARVRTVPGAVLVKRCDASDNSDPGRLALLDPETRARLERKYADTLAQL